MCTGTLVSSPVVSVSSGVPTEPDEKVGINVCIMFSSPVTGARNALSSAALKVEAGMTTALT